MRMGASWLALSGLRKQWASVARKRPRSRCCARTACAKWCSSSRPNSSAPRGTSSTSRSASRPRSSRRSRRASRSTSRAHARAARRHDQARQGHRRQPGDHRARRQRSGDPRRCAAPGYRERRGLQATLLNAKSIAYAKAGQSRVYFVGLLDRLGIADAVKRRAGRGDRGRGRRRGGARRRRARRAAGERDPAGERCRAARPVSGRRCKATW